MNKFAPSVTALVLMVGLVDAAEVRTRSSADPYSSLPSAIRTLVTRRGCRAPKFGSEGDVMSVARGSFFAPQGSSGEGRDFAVACIRKGKNEVLVFKNGNEQMLTVLGFFGGTMEACGDGSVSLVEAKDIEAEVRVGTIAIGDDSLDVAERQAPVHDGIVDGDCDGLSIVHYWTGRRWVALPGAD